MPTENTPGSRLRAARLAAGLTQQQVADKAGMRYKAALSDLEHDRRPKVTLDTLYALAVAIGCRPSDLDDRLTDKVCGKSELPIGDKREDR